MTKKFLLQYHWTAFSLLTLVLGIRALGYDLNPNSSDIYFFFKFLNSPDYAIFVMLIAIVSGLAYFPWPEKYHKEWLPALQTVCIAAMVMIWTLFSIGYFLDGDHYFIGFTGLIIVSQILVRAYCEPYKPK